MPTYCADIVSIFDLKVDAVVNPINCKGAMGKGLALEFKKRFPLNFSYYKKQCQVGAVKIGQMLVYKTMLVKRSPRLIINFPTKNDWRDPSDMVYITEGLKELLKVCIAEKVTNIAIPKIGCGLGGLDWEDVYPEIRNVFQAHPEIQVYLWGRKPVGVTIDVYSDLTPDFPELHDQLSQLPERSHQPFDDDICDGRY